MKMEGGGDEKRFLLAPVFCSFKNFVLCSVARMWGIKYSLIICKLYVNTV